VAERLSRELAVILHADVIGSTRLVQQNETLAHQRVQDVFRRFSGTIQTYAGTAREIRGDALVAEFEKVSDAVCAALAFQVENAEFNATLDGDIKPELRMGIGMGEVVIADNTVTGVGVVLAQRLEQLAGHGGVCIQGAAYETLPKRLPFDYEALGDRELKGFEEPVRVYAVTLRPGETIPLPERPAAPVSRPRERPRWRWAAVSVIALLCLAGAGLLWLRPWAPATIEQIAFPLPDKPSIAVLPIANLSDDPQQAFFADGMTDDLITDLSKLSGLFVIARNSSFAYKERSVDVRQVSEELGVQYVLEGSIRRVGDRIRINAQLIDATTGGNLWTERYDKQFDDVFSIQDDITQLVVTSLEVTLTEGEQARYRRGQTKDVKAYEFYTKGLEHYRRSTPADNAEVLRFFEAAVSRDPDFLHALADIGWTELNNWRFQWGAKPKESFARAQKAAKDVLSSDEEHSTANALLGALFRYQGDFENAIVYGRRAVETEPNGADVMATLATTLMYAGESESALTHIERAMRLSPRHPSWYLFTLGAVHRQLGHYEKAVEYHEKWRDRSDPRSLNPYLALVYSYTLAGRDEDAKAAAVEVLKRNPKFTINGWVNRAGYASEEEVARIVDAFRKAGLPDSPA
jgi:adenylate cyclase